MDNENLPTDTQEAYDLLAADPDAAPKDDAKAQAYATAHRKYVNMHRFFMHIWQAGVLDCSSYGIYALRDGIEELDLDAEEAPGQHECPRAMAVEIAAASVQEAAPAMYACTDIMGPNGNPDWPSNAGAPGRGGKRWQGVDGYTPQRWALWKTIFMEIVEGKGKYKLPDYTVEASRRALAAMEKAEAGSK